MALRPFTSIRLVVAACSVLLAIAWSAGTGRAALQATSQAASQPAPTQDLWVKQWVVAESTADAPAMARLIKGQPTEAIEFFCALARDWTLTRDPPTRERMDRFKQALGAVHGEVTVAEKIEQFFTGLDAAPRKELQPILARLDEAASLLEAARKSQKAEDFATTHAQAIECARKLTEIGYKLEAAKAWALAAQALAARPGATDEDSKQAVEHLEQFKRLREEWSWTRDLEWFGHVSFLESELKRLYRWALCPVSARTDPAEYEGLTVWGGALPLSWLSVPVVLDENGKDHRGRLSWFLDAGIHVLRPSANKFLAGPHDKTAEAELDELKVGNRPAVGTFRYRRAGKDASYSMWLYVASDQEVHQGITLNLAPTWNDRNRTAVLYYRSAMSYAATLHGVPVLFHDENTTGVLGDDPVMADGMLSRRPGQPGSHPTMDAMTIGGARVPFSNLVRLGGDWCRIRVLRNHEAIDVRVLDRAAVPTGTLAVKWNGPMSVKPRSLVVREIGSWKGSCFEVMANPRGVEVPAGEYEILYGRFAGGKGANATSGIVLRGLSKSFPVVAGKAATLELGGPFALEFELTTSRMAGRFGRASVDAGKASVHAFSTWVKGRAGERYAYLLDEVIEPEVLVSADETGRNAKVVGRFKRMSSDEIFPAIADCEREVGKDAIQVTTAPCFPINAARPAKEATFVVDFELAGGQCVGLRQKGHRLFGELKSVFK